MSSNPDLETVINLIVSHDVCGEVVFNSI